MYPINSNQYNKEFNTVTSVKTNCSFNSDVNNIQ